MESVGARIIIRRLFAVSYLSIIRKNALSKLIEIIIDEFLIVT